MTFGASVVIELPWSFAGRGGRRCGESRLFSPMIRSTRVRLTRMPSITRSRAHTLRWPSPVHGERARSRRMAARRRRAPVSGRVDRPVSRAAVPPGAGRRKTRIAPRPRSRTHGAPRKRARSPTRSRRPSARPPAGQRAGLLQPRTQQLVLHAQLADAAMRLGDLALLRIVITLPQPGVDPGKPALPPLLQLPHRHREPTGQVFDGLAPHQPEHHVPLARKAPPLTGRQCCDHPVILGCGQRRRASLAPAAHSPNSHIHPWILFIHQAAPRGSRLDNVVSTETGCSSLRRSCSRLNAYFPKLKRSFVKEMRNARFAAHSFSGCRQTDTMVATRTSKSPNGIRCPKSRSSRSSTKPPHSLNAMTGTPAASASMTTVG